MQVKNRNIRKKIIAKLKHNYRQIKNPRRYPLRETYKQDKSEMAEMSINNNVILKFSI